MYEPMTLCRADPDAESRSASIMKPLIDHQPGAYQ
jgi:hypothetical protein